MRANVFFYSEFNRLTCLSMGSDFDADTGVVGYNVQTAVDAEHHLIVAPEVTNQGHDRTQLTPMPSRPGRPPARKR